MKNSSFVIAALFVMALSSCYVGIEERRHRHHGTRIEIRGDNSKSQKDSLQSDATTIGNRKDSVQAPLRTDSLK